MSFYIMATLVPHYIINIGNMSYKKKYLVYIGKITTFKDKKMVLEGRLFFAHSKTIESIIDTDVLDEHFDVRNISSRFLKEAHKGVLLGDISNLKKRVKEIEVISMTRD